MKQHEVIFKVLKELGGYATFADLYKKVLDDPEFEFKTKTPRETIRRIVQDWEKKVTFRLRPGIWGLMSEKDRIPPELYGKAKDPDAQRQSDHSLYQGMWLDIGRARNFKTYVPAQDRNRKFLSTPLGNMTDIERLLPFSYEKIVQRASTVDVVWFNSRNLPAAFIEVENSTDFQNSLGKFTDLQDFYADFLIVAPSDKEMSFRRKLDIAAYESIRHRVKFRSYDETGSLHAKRDEFREFLKLGQG